MTDHTPTPWEFAGAMNGSTMTIYHDDGTPDAAGKALNNIENYALATVIAEGNGPPWETTGAANAALIVRAVNSHEQLVAALTGAVEYIENQCEATYENSSVIGNARAALKEMAGRPG